MAGIYSEHTLVHTKRLESRMIRIYLKSRTPWALVLIENQDSLYLIWLYFDLVPLPKSHTNYGIIRLGADYVDEAPPILDTFTVFPLFSLNLARRKGLMYLLIQTTFRLYSSDGNPKSHPRNLGHHSTFKINCYVWTNLKWM